MKNIQHRNIAYILVGLLVLFGLASFLTKNAGMANMLTLNIKQTEQADPRMTPDQMERLYGATWVWDATLFSDNSRTLPKKSDAFTLSFSKSDSSVGDRSYNSQMNGTTDCNGFSGPAMIGADNTVEIGALASTQKFCTGSQESAFTQSVTEVNGFVIDDNGELILTLKNDYGAMYFKRKAEAPAVAQ